MVTKKPTNSLSGRALHEKVKTSHKRRLSSTLWLERQLNDPYVAEARKLGYRSRAAFKLLQLQEKYHFLKEGMVVVDLGAAPGGWSQVAAKIIHAEKGPEKSKGTVIAMDYLEFPAIAGVRIFQQDFLSDAALTTLNAEIGEHGVDCVLSDMAAPTTGHTPTDHMRIVDLCENAFQFACSVLRPNGTFVCKVLQGGTETNLLKTVKKRFSKTHHAKPAASRKDSAEIYLVAMGFKG
jgi:23S rRNA (uridine2552-2'-O)-methyltransferase